MVVMCQFWFIIWIRAEKSSVKSEKQDGACQIGVPQQPFVFNQGATSPVQILN